MPVKKIKKKKKKKNKEDEDDLDSPDRDSMKRLDVKSNNSPAKSSPRRGSINSISPHRKDELLPEKRIKAKGKKGNS